MYTGPRPIQSLYIMADYVIKVAKEVEALAMLTVTEYSQSPNFTAYNQSRLSDQ